MDQDFSAFRQRQETPALELCLVNLGAALGRPVSASVLETGRQSGLSEAGLISHVISAGERAGMQGALRRVRFAEAQDFGAPVILLLEGGAAVTLHGAEADGRLILFDPALGDELVTAEAKEISKNYSGYALLFRPRHREASGDGAPASPAGHWLWSALAQNKWAYSQVVLAAAVSNILGLGTSLFTMVVYDRILPNQAVDSLIALTIGVGVALGFDFLIKLLRAGFTDRAGQKADMVAGRRIFEQLLTMQMKAQTGSTGALSNTLREFETLREFFTSASLTALVNLPFIGLFVAVIWVIGGDLAWVPLICVPLVLLIGVGVQPALAKLSGKSFEDSKSKQSILVETIAGLETIKVSGAAPQMRARWEEAIARQSEHSLKSRGVTQFAISATAMIQQGAQIMLVFWGVFLIGAGELSMGALIGSVILTGRALAPLGQIAQMMTRINQARTAYRNISKMMQAGSERPEGRDWLHRRELRGGFRLDEVSFAYPGQENAALRDVSLEIAPGEKVAILGRIGSGKSTLARLLLGLYAPADGVVLADDTDIRQIDPVDLRRNIGAVLQDVWLFSGSVKENIAIGAAQPDDEAILRAAMISGVHDFVSKHPEGYDQMLRERGDGLSGGQKQAIALARALTGDPPVLLLDEPTSAMDVQTEAAVISRLKESCAGKTMIIVTHRASLLDLVDRVIVMSDGQIVADGPKSILKTGAEPSPEREGGA